MTKSTLKVNLAASGLCIIVTKIVPLRTGCRARIYSSDQYFIFKSNHTYELRIIVAKRGSIQGTKRLRTKCNLAVAQQMKL